MIVLQVMLLSAFGASMGDANVVERLPNCGVAAIYGISQILGSSVSPASIEATIKSRSPEADLAALSMKDIRLALSDLGLHSESLRLEAHDLKHVPTPCIVYIRPSKLGSKDTGVGHVVVATSITDDDVRILDLTLSSTPIVMKLQQFRDNWDGEFVTAQRESQPLTSVWRVISAYRVFWIVVLACSLIAFGWSVLRPPARSSLSLDN
jgi:ABC-type bacteriocin/lantibiotic exporter with double-glycine peptidase domain